MNLLDPNAKKETDISRAKVIESLGGNRYKVKDSTTGRFYNVYSEAPQKRNTFVRVSKGIVVGVSKIVTKQKIVSI